MSDWHVLLGIPNTREGRVAKSFCRNRSQMTACLKPNRFIPAVITVEKRPKVRLGVAVMDTEIEQRRLYQAGERFLMFSTFNVIGAAAFLAKVDKGKGSLVRKVVIDESNLASYSPLTEIRTVSVGTNLAEIF